LASLSINLSPTITATKDRAEFREDSLSPARDPQPRESVQWQLLKPLLAVLITGFFLASLTNAWLAIVTARANESARINELSASLQKASFPLNASVFKQLEELTGARFVALAAPSSSQNSISYQSPQLSYETGQLIVKFFHLVRLSSRPQNIHSGGENWLTRTIERPVGLPQGPASQLIILLPVESWQSLWWRTAFPPVLAGTLAAFVCVVVVIWISRRLTGPLLDVASQTTQIAQGNLSLLPVPHRNDEIRDLIVNVNSMSQELVQLHQSIRHGEQLRTLGQLGAGFAHQLRNAALGARMALEFSERGDSSSSDNESVQIALAQLQRMELYLDRFLRLSRPDRAHSTEENSGHVSSSQTMIRLGGLADGVLQLIEPLARHRHVELHKDTSTFWEVEVQGDLVALEQMLSNVVINALEAASSMASVSEVSDQLAASSRFEPSVVLKCLAADHDVEISVCDNGPGPPANVQQTLFQPFVTTRPEGCGLGLSVAQEIATGHGGEITWSRQQEPDGTMWTIFRIRLKKQR
jgi:signal transduction histidine kinase